MKNKKVFTLVIIFLILVFDLLYVRFNLMNLNIIQYLILVFLMPLIVSTAGAYVYMKNMDFVKKKVLTVSIIFSAVLTFIISIFQKVYLTEDAKSVILLNSEYIKGLNISFETGGAGSVVFAFLIIFFVIYNICRLASRAK